MYQSRVGSVTMLFTDIEGSTRLAAGLGERWAVALEHHHQLLSRAVRGQGGEIESREGDAVFALFERAEQAIAAARAGQAALREHSWPGGQQLRVRMGVHTGELSRLPTGVAVGLDIHLAARVASAANGGQVLLTQATVAQSGGVAVEDLGLHRLKDFPVAERLFHLIDGDGPVPAPRTLSARPTNLPPVRGPVFGRDTELAEIKGRLLAEGSRLMTLTGPGGAGKTTLAIEAGRRSLDEFPGGVFLVRLVALGDEAGVLAAIAEAMGVPQPADGDVLGAVGDRLASLRTLLILDNAEHVLPTVGGLLDQLMARAPDVMILLTSQKPLRVAGESLLPVAALDTAAAVELLQARAAAAGSPVAAELLPTAQRICVRIGGLPLAVELAAARVPVLGLSELERRLADSLAVLSRGRRDLPERQRSLRQTLEWTYRLLGPCAQSLLARLSLFAGPVQLREIEAVCGEGIDTLDELAELVELSLVQRHEDRLFGTRYAMAEAVREFAAEHLAEPATIAARHAEQVAAVAWAARLWVFGPTDDQRRRVLALGAEERPALAWARAHDPELHLRLAGGLGTSWLLRGQAREALEHLQYAVQRSAPSDERLWARGVLAHVLASMGRGAEAVKIADEAVTEWRVRQDVISLSLALNVRSYARIAVGDVTGSMADAEEANCGLSTSSDPRLRVRGLTLLASKVIALGEPDPLERLLDQAERLVDDVDVTVYIRDMRADCCLMRHDYLRTLTSYLEVAKHTPEAPETVIYGTYAIEGLALAHAGLGYSRQALELYAVYSVGLTEAGVNPPEHEWREQLTDHLLAGARQDRGPLAAGDSATGRAVPPARRLAWAIEQAEKTLAELTSRSGPIPARQP